MAADMQGKVCVVTGANSGIGKETALGLARLGATVVLVCRSQERGTAALAEIEQQSGNDSVSLLVADLSSQRQVRRVAAAYRQQFDRLDVLVNNAALSRRHRAVTEDSVELTLAVNHLAPFLLTNLLLDRLKASAPARVVTVSSAAHKDAEINFADLQGEQSYATFGFGAYSQSKLANVLFTYELARRLEGAGVHGQLSAPRRRRHGHLPRYAAVAAGWTYTGSPIHPGVRTGRRHGALSRHRSRGGRGDRALFRERKPVQSSPLSYDTEVARRLWEVSEALTTASGPAAVGD